MLVFLTPPPPPPPPPAPLAHLSFWHSLANDGPANDQSRLPISVGLGVANGLVNRHKVVAVNRLNVPAVRLVPHADVLALGVLGHLVEGDVVAVEEHHQVVELLVGGEAGSLATHALLDAPVSAQGEDGVVEDLVVGGVEAGGGPADLLG